MSTIRIKKDTNFAVIDKTPINDQRLDWDALGLHAYLLSKPNDWQINEAHLVGFRKAGRDKIRRMIRELKDCGYLVRTRKRRPDGTFYTEDLLYEKPQKATDDGLSGDGLPDDGLPDDGKPVDILSNEGLSNDRLRMKTKTVGATPPPPPLPPSPPSLPSPPKDTPKAAPPEDSSWEEFRQLWGAYFPTKSQPRKANRTLQAKLKTRLKSTDFSDAWKPALQRASQSSFLQSPESTWFDASWFLKNDDHWDRCFNGKYDDKSATISDPILSPNSGIDMTAYAIDGE